MLGFSLCLCVSGVSSQTAGNGTLFLGLRPNRIAIIDEATEKVTGAIETRHGIPIRLSLSKDKKRFYILNTNYERIEVADVAARQIIDSFTLTDGDKKVRIRSFEVEPQHRFMILLAKSATKKEDRWEIGANELLQYDLKEHKVMRKIPWPKGEEREFAGLMFSPDGKLLYLFGDDILIFETSEFKEVDKWELSRPYEEGFGRLNFNALDDTYDAPGFFTGLFTVQDAVQNRRIMGIGRLDMVGKKVDFTALGPATGVSFSLAPDRKTAYGLQQQIGRYEFWTFDVENKRVAGRREFAGRPRMSLKTSSNGKVLYIYEAGNTIDLYDAATYKYLRTITLDSDMTTGLVIMPPAK
jgi:DNA-binding beta-propeller fold protein YncE